MNWKVIALLPAIAIATALPAYSVTKGQTPNQATTATHAAPTIQANSTKKVNTVKKTTVKKQSTNVAKRSTVLTVGSKGEAVKTAQNLLKQKGFYTGEVNGVFDKNTRAAVIKFQKSKKLRADGIIGSRTLAALQ
ncbi:peptidoglycan-binding protein [Nostoc sp. FACHB-110]|uniref:peptidoglycan-binding domain-containing protein n=1 Tax=Nostoc sp. FACHB-110 TaxID=2692834 RepID=UPI001686E215|nr:peptidoglycan-binding domain-containing protein [Nostoc sp. FACHB-110]MBD2440433.1 peptidoglycan-binding protein [Nostoc sp. FACHB-110]